MKMINESERKEQFEKADKLLFSEQDYTHLWGNAYKNENVNLRYILWKEAQYQTTLPSTVPVDIKMLKETLKFYADEGGLRAKQALRLTAKYEEQNDEND